MSDMKGKWDYSQVRAPKRYGNDNITYKKAMKFLADCKEVEDWGCGTAYARKFCRTKYIGIDGSGSKFIDKVEDLKEYASDVEGILLRHVLEHNIDWERVLENAIKSFHKKLVLVIFTPWQTKTKRLAWNRKRSVCIVGAGSIPNIGFRKEDVTKFFEGMRCKEEALRTGTQYGIETIFYVKKIKSCLRARE